MPTLFTITPFSLSINMLQLSSHPGIQIAILSLHEGIDHRGIIVRTILVLSDSLTVRIEAVQYSIELAKRTNCGVVFLMLLPIITEESPGASEDAIDEIVSRIRSTLRRNMTEAEKAGVAAEALVRVGDPQSELMKFLASSSTTQTIVWAGREDLKEAGANRKNTHWLVKAKGVVECPVVVPSMKS